MGTKNELSAISALNENPEQELMKWKEFVVVYGEMSDFKPVQLAGAMAAYLIRYRNEWKETFVTLKKCLLHFLADDLIFKDAEKEEDVKDTIISAMRKNKDDGC